MDVVKAQEQMLARRMVRPGTIKFGAMAHTQDELSFLSDRLRPMPIGSAAKSDQQFLKKIVDNH